MKLSHVYELPAKLQHCLDKGEYVRAAGLYSRAIGVLVAYAAVPSFRNVCEETERISREIRKRVRTDFRQEDMVCMTF